MQDFGYFFVSNTKYSLTKAQGSFIDITATSVPFVESPTYKSMQTEKERSFDDKTVAEIVTQIAKEHGLKSYCQ